MSNERKDLLNILLANSWPEKKETGEIILPCFTSKGQELLTKLFEDNRDVRIAYKDVCFSSLSNQDKLSKFRIDYPGVDLLCDKLGIKTQ